MRHIYIVLTLLALNWLPLAAQKQISCKSGQDIVVDGASNFISSNLEQLVAEKAMWSAEAVEAYKELLQSEQKNRLELVKLERLQAILEYDAQRATTKDEKNAVKAKQQTAKKDISQCDKEYDKITAQIQGLTKKQEAIVRGEVEEKKVEKTVEAEKLAEPEKTIPQAEPAAQMEDKKEKMVINPIDEEKEKMKAAGCAIKFKGRDSISKKKRTILESQQLLTYTPEKMKNYFKLKDFLTISIASDIHNGDYSFDVEARFASKDVMRSYGVIHKSDFLRLQFINGKRVFLKILDAPEPSLDKQSGETIYKVRCALSNGQDFSMLENGWLDSFGIMWSTGFEDYTVYDVDFMQRQLRCLNHD